MSSQTRHALRVIEEYLSGLNEAVQYCLAYMTDLVTQAPSGIVGGIQAGGVPANHVVADTNAEVFAVNATPGSSPGALSLNLHTGALMASWTVNGSTIDVSGEVRCVESISPPPTNRFLFVVEVPTSGFYVLNTTNI